MSFEYKDWAGASFEDWLQRMRDNGVLAQVNFDDDQLPPKVRVAVQKMISKYQLSSPENPLHTIRFMKAPTYDWEECHGPTTDNEATKDNEEVVRSWEEEGYLVLQINATGTEILQRGNIGYRLGVLKEKSERRSAV